MSDDLLNLNGGPPSELRPLVITLTLTPTAQGYVMGIQHDPQIFADQVIDACTRAARYYERIAIVQQMQALQQQGRMTEEQLRRIQGRLMS